MSSFLRPEPSHKLHALDVPLHDLPSPFDTALNSPTRSDTKNHEDLLDPDSFRRFSTSTLGGLSNDGLRSRSRSRFRTPYPVTHAYTPTPPPAPPRLLHHFWQRNRGLLLVAISQLFSALMNVTTRLLELEGSGMHPLQILFTRMSITSLCCCAYMHYASTPHFPFGPKGLRALLAARGITGFFGIFGMYYSLQYLPVADATVLTFLAPAVASLGCAVFLGEKFSRGEQLASVVSLAGVVLIARPTSFFNLSADVAATTTTITTTTAASNPASTFTGAEGPSTFHPPTPTSAQHLSAIGVSLLGVLGTAGALTTIRLIGKRAHALLTVNYFAVLSTLVSVSALVLITPAASPLHTEGVGFKLPASARQWGMLVALGGCGFVMQVLLTVGLAHERGSRANGMVYMQVLFAVGLEAWVFGVVPGGWSLLGGVLVLGGAVGGAVVRAGEVEGGREMEGREMEGRGDEEVGLLGGGEGVGEDEEQREEVVLEVLDRADARHGQRVVD